MNDAKYIGLDVRQATVSEVVLDSTGEKIGLVTSQGSSLAPSIELRIAVRCLAS
jgi:hypothetical protein